MQKWIPEWLKQEYLWDVKARTYKNRNARKNVLRTLAELLEIIQNFLRIQGFTQKVLCFLFCLVFEIIAIVIVVAASSSLIVHSVEIEIKELK